MRNAAPKPDFFGDYRKLNDKQDLNEKQAAQKPFQIEGKLTAKNYRLADLTALSSKGS